jgi:hypothetical protein
MNDNDILIKPDEALKAWNLLQQAGFSNEPLKSPLHKKIMTGIGKHLPSLYKEGYAIEIHHRLHASGNWYRATDDRRQRAKGMGQGARGNTDDPSSVSTFGLQPATRNPQQLTDHRFPLSVDPFETSREILIGGTKAYILSEEMQLRYLIDHFERHKEEGSCQFRLYTDIKLLDKNSKIEIPDSFIQNPIQENKPRYRKKAYRSTLYEIPPKQRLRFLIGDIFPSVKWMKTRYKCGGLKALFYYPVRLAKLIWLI